MNVVVVLGVERHHHQLRQVEKCRLVDAMATVYRAPADAVELAGHVSTSLCADWLRFAQKFLPVRDILRARPGAVAVDIYDVRVVGAQLGGLSAIAVVASRVIEQILARARDLAAPESVLSSGFHSLIAPRIARGHAFTNAPDICVVNGIVHRCHDCGENNRHDPAANVHQVLEADPQELCSVKLWAAGGDDSMQDDHRHRVPHVHLQIRDLKNEALHLAAQPERVELRLAAQHQTCARGGSHEGTRGGGQAAVAGLRAGAPKNITIGTLANIKHLRSMVQPSASIQYETSM